MEQTEPNQRHLTGGHRLPARRNFCTRLLGVNGKESTMTENFDDYEQDDDVKKRYGIPDYRAWQHYLHAEKTTGAKKKSLALTYHLFCATKHLLIDKAQRSLNKYTLVIYQKKAPNYLSGATSKNLHLYSEPSVFSFIYTSKRWESQTPIQSVANTLNTGWAQYVCESMGVDLQDVQARLDQFSSENHTIANHDHNARQTETLTVKHLNTILYGPPGTGKTYHTVDLALYILDHQFWENHKDERHRLKQRFDDLMENGRIELVTFHQSFSYEDFVEGLRASTNDAGQLIYSVEDGVFKKLCRKGMDLQLQSDSPESIVLIIDEINRGNIANILGELITLIEPDKRAGMPEALNVTLPYSKETFSVPSNLYLIATMNTADRSIAHIDTALRRRFRFQAMMPDINVLTNLGVQDIDGIDIQRMLKTINARIELLYDREHTLGHSFFIPLKEHKNIEKLAEVFEYQILPLLEEYFFEDWGRIRQVLGDDFKDSDELSFYAPAYSDKEISELFSGDSAEPLIDKTFERNIKALQNPNAYIGIYQR